jgi:hypothetical protein
LLDKRGVERRLEWISGLTQAEKVSFFGDISIAIEHKITLLDGLL